MARRAVAGRFGFRVPGVRDALAARWRRLDDRWDGRSFGRWADAAESGAALLVDGQTLWLALFAVSPRVAAAFEHDPTHYEVLNGVDQLAVSDADRDHADVTIGREQKVTAIKA